MLQFCDKGTLPSGDSVAMVGSRRYPKEERFQKRKVRIVLQFYDKGGCYQDVPLQGRGRARHPLHPTDSGVKSARHLFFTSQPTVTSVTSDGQWRKVGKTPFFTSHPTSVTSGGQWRQVGKTPFFHLPPADSNVKILTLTDLNGEGAS